LASEPAKLVFVGLMAVGKTTVGRLVAAELGRPLSDSDAEIERAEGASAKLIAATRGADELHELEAAHLLGALADPEPLVICAAASVVDREDCRAALAAPGVAVIWLTASPAELAERFFADPHRPAYDADTERMLRDQLAARERSLTEVATETIATATLTPGDIAKRVVQLVGGSPLDD
jgi:shikimate kinase